MAADGQLRIAIGVRRQHPSIVESLDLSSVLTLDNEFDDAKWKLHEVRGGAYPHLQVERLAASASARRDKCPKSYFGFDFHSVWIDLHFWVSLIFWRELMASG